jgi:hypothetical protein
MTQADQDQARTERIQVGRGHRVRLLLGDAKPADVAYILLRTSGGWEPVEDFLGFESSYEDVVSWRWQGRVHHVLADELVGIATGSGAT